MQYFNFFKDLCNLSINSEYYITNFHQSSKCRRLGSCYRNRWIYNRTHEFICSKEDRNIVNIATGVLIEAKEKNMLLECISNGDKACNEFVKCRLERHQKQLSDAIPKSMTNTIVSTKKKSIDVHLQSTKALKICRFCKS